MTVSRLKPPVRATRTRAYHQRVHRTLSRALEARLLETAQVLSEGDCHGTSSALPSYTGSTMLTIDLAQSEPTAWAELSTLPPAVRTDIFDGSVRLRLRAMRLALAEASRRCMLGQLGTAQVETRVRLEGGVLQIDVDVDAPVLQLLDGQGEG